VGVNLVKRYVADAATAAPPIVGSRQRPQGGRRGRRARGPHRGLLLAKKGYEVRILDAHPRLGGTLRYGIPDYAFRRTRGPRHRPHPRPRREGHCGVRLGKDFTLDSLRATATRRCCSRSARSRPSAGRPGEQTPGVVGGVDFLAQVKEQGAPELKGTVVTVGGGNTAVDAARTALRCGASRSVIVYRRTARRCRPTPGRSRTRWPRA
jgi:NADPH-dependent glutamate synthase beta subunit-like oxidoreductase